VSVLTDPGGPDKNDGSALVLGSMRRLRFRTMRIAALALVAACCSSAAAQDRSRLTELGYDGDVAAQKAIKTGAPCPGAADDHALIGTTPPEWTFSDWVGSPPLTLRQLRGRVVVVRFWTRGCEFCDKSMPALQQLATELRSQPVTIIGAFHSKPANAVTDMSAAAKTAKGWGVTFPLAFDREWRTLRAWYLDGKHRHATSVTFVFGKDGKVVHVHPGPVYFPSSAPSDAAENRDFLALRAAIQTALK
jgi:thiol-disulfide isomerase/thioredoxin